MSDAPTTPGRSSVVGFPADTPGVTPPLDPDRRGTLLSDVIVELGLAERNAVERAVEASRQSGADVGRSLLESGDLDEDGLARAVAEWHGLEYLDLGELEVDHDAARLISPDAARRYRAVPVASAPDGALIVALEDPVHPLAISDIEVMTRSEVRPAVAAGSAIEALIDRVSRPAGVDGREPSTPPPPPPPPPPPATIPSEAPSSEAQQGSASDSLPDSDLPPDPDQTPEPDETPPSDSAPEPELPLESEQFEAAALDGMPPPGEPESPEALEAPEPEPVEDEPELALENLPTELRSLCESAKRAERIAQYALHRIEGLEDVEGRARTAESELERLLGVLAEAEARNQEVEQRAGTAEGEVERLLGELSDLQTRTDELITRNEALERRIAAVVAAAAEAKAAAEKVVALDLSVSDDSEQLDD